jgi:hypothetical protein
LSAKFDSILFLTVRFTALRSELALQSTWILKIILHTSTAFILCYMFQSSYLNTTTLHGRHEDVSLRLSTRHPIELLLRRRHSFRDPTVRHLSFEKNAHQRRDGCSCSSHFYRTCRLTGGLVLKQGDGRGHPIHLRPAFLQAPEVVASRRSRVLIVVPFPRAHVMQRRRR